MAKCPLNINILCLIVTESWKLKVETQWFSFLGGAQQESGQTAQALHV